MLADAGLDGGLLVGGDDVLIGAQRCVVAAAGVEVEHPGCLGPEVGVAGEDRQERCCQGLIASALSQRQIVVPEIEAVMPDSTAARTRSGHCQRASGVSVFAGSSQASALMATTTSGGKTEGILPEADRSVRPDAGRRSVCAIWRRLGAAYLQACGDLVVA